MAALYLSKQITLVKSAPQIVKPVNHTTNVKSVSTIILLLILQLVHRVLILHIP